MNDELATIEPNSVTPTLTTEQQISECHRMLTELMEWKAEMDEVLSGIIEQFSGGGVLSLMGGLFGKR